MPSRPRRARQISQELDNAIRTEIASLADEMQAHGTGRDDPPRAIMTLVGDRWTALILLVLAAGTLRHADLKRLLGELSSEGAISQRVLTLKLRALEREGMVWRQTSDDVPPKVAYGLTSLGIGLHSRVRDMLDWINVNEPAIRCARETFDQSD